MSRTLLPTSGYTINPATEIQSKVVGICSFLEIDLPTGTLYLTDHNRPITWGGNTYYPSIPRGGTVPVGTGNGSQTSFAQPAGWDSDSKLYVNDWQGNQLQYSTPRTNLILQSSSLQTTPWVLDDAPLAANSGTAPDGSNTAFLFNDKTDVTDNQHNLYSSTVGASGSVYKISIDAKAGTTPGIALGLYGNSQWDAYAYFDLSIGAVHSTGYQAGTPTITPLPEAGWYRCEITSIPLTGATGDTPYLRLLTPTWQEYYIGASLYNVYLQNAQVSPTDGSYIPTTTAAVTVTDYSLSGGNIVFANAPNLAAAITAQIPPYNGSPYGVMGNYNEGTDGIPRPMSLMLSGVDPTLIEDLVSNNVQWIKIVWSLGLLDSNYNLLNGTPVFSTPQFLGDCTISLSKNKGTISINAENLLADLQNRTSGCLQTVEDQQSRGASGNSTFSKDTFYTFVASLTYVFIYWGMSRPFQIGRGGGPGPNPNKITGGWWQSPGRAF